MIKDSFADTHVDQTSAVASHDVSVEDADDIGDSMKEAFGWASMAPSAADSGSQPASQEALAALRECYDNLNQTMNHTKKMCHDLGSISPDHSAIVSDTLRIKVDAVQLVFAAGRLIWPGLANSNRSWLPTRRRRISEEVWRGRVRYPKHRGHLWSTENSCCIDLEQRMCVAVASSIAGLDLLIAMNPDWRDPKWFVTQPSKQAWHSVARPDPYPDPHKDPPNRDCRFSGGWEGADLVGGEGEGGGDRCGRDCRLSGGWG